MCCWILWASRVYDFVARWRYASLCMRQNGKHMCLRAKCTFVMLLLLLRNVCNRWFDAIRISNRSCCSIQCAPRWWPTNTISLIYCNGFKLCECTSLWMAVYSLVTTPFSSHHLFNTIKCILFVNSFSFFLSSFHRFILNFLNSLIIILCSRSPVLNCKMHRQRLKLLSPPYKFFLLNSMVTQS